MELEELEMISNKVKFGIVIIGLLGGLFLVLHYVIYPNLATGETRYLLWKAILDTLFSSLSVAGILGSGRYTRDITLPSLMNLCEEQHRTMHVCIYILDPRDENVCRMYATYSNLVTPGNVVTQANVKCDLLATIIAAYFYGRTLNIDVYLKNHFSIFKREFSDNMVLVTREDRTKPGVVYSKGSDFYDAYKMELEQGRKLYTHLDRQVSWGDDLQRCEDISKQHIRQLLALLNLSVNITDIELDMIQKFVSSKTSPYIR